MQQFELFPKGDKSYTPCHIDKVRELNPMELLVLKLQVTRILGLGPTRGGSSSIRPSQLPSWEKW